jgi:type VI secretion system secreted protein VgrG
VATGAIGTALILDGIVGISPASAAQSSVGLGTATSFAVLAGQTVTNTGPSVISGDLGVSPGTAITGFPPGVITGGTRHAGDAVALQAQSDLTTAFNDAAGRTPPTAVPADLGGLTLAPGVYKAPSALGLTGTVTLDAHGDSSAVFIFQVGSTLITASNSTVNLIGSAQACNVFWQIGSSATLGTNTTFVGSILALTSASVQTGTTVSGRVLARNGQVSLDNNVITRPGCAAATPTPSASTSASPSATASATSTGGTKASPSASTTSSSSGGVGPPAAGSPTPTSTRSATRPPGSTPPATGTPTPIGTRGFKSPGPGIPRTHYPIPPGFPQTGAGGASPGSDRNSGALVAAGAVALLGAAVAARQAARRRKGVVRPG